MELGSEFNLRLNDIIKSENNIYNYLSEYRQIHFNNGRSTLMFLDQVLPAGKVLLPEYICDCVPYSFKKHGVISYRINRNLEIDIKDLEDKIDQGICAVMIMNYFGHLQSCNTIKKLEDIKRNNDIIYIEDTTHSIFSASKTIGDYAICSLRKWGALPDGGCIYYDRDMTELKADSYNVNMNLEKVIAMVMKTFYLNGEYECNAKYRKIFEAAENSFDSQEVPMCISDFSRYLLECLDIKDIINKRKRNTRRLKQGLKGNKYIIPIIEFTDDECPFTFPVYVDNRDRFRQYLIENNIFCAVHWPMEDNDINNRTIARGISDSIISLPIDQRYDENEIDYMLNIIDSY